jgi:hypothetical protein
LWRTCWAWHTSPNDIIKMTAPTLETKARDVKSNMVAPLTKTKDWRLSA